MSAPSSVPAAFVSSVHQALKTWNSPQTDTSPLADLLLVQHAQLEGMYSLRRAGNVVLSRALDKLAENDEAAATLLRQRFEKQVAVFVVARTLHMAEATFYKHQRSALEALAGWLYALESEARTSTLAAAATRLPQNSTQKLFGVEAVLQQISAALQAPHLPAVLLLSGIGGQGKSTVAHAAVQTVIQRATDFAEVGWVSAKQESFHPGNGIRNEARPALTADALIYDLALQLLPESARLASTAQRMALLHTRLHQVPHLIVIDNLETVIDVEALLPLLNRLGGLSRFLLTSRKTLPGEDAIYHLPLPELNAPDALALLRYEAGVRNLGVITAATDADLLPIYHTVGGNPLSLKLIIGQLYSLPLPAVLENLRQARGSKTTQLYKYIYWNSWNQLQPQAQDVLLCLPNFAQSGADLSAIERICDVKGEALVEQLEELARHSLVIVSGNLQRRTYAIHRLTETFLMREVIRWQGYHADWDGDAAPSTP
ncbi:MAG: hypothetical protein ABTQ73_14220 [Caldilineales bacterium]